jgi:hypothetical protein
MNESYGEYGKSYEDETPKEVIKFLCLKVKIFSLKRLRLHNIC